MMLESWKLNFNFNSKSLVRIRVRRLALPLPQLPANVDNFVCDIAVRRCQNRVTNEKRKTTQNETKKKHFLYLFSGVCSALLRLTHSDSLEKSKFSRENVYATHTPGAVLLPAFKSKANE